MQNRKHDAKRDKVAAKKKAVVAPLVIDVNQRYSLVESSATLRQSEATTYNQIRSGKLRVIRDGGRTYIPGSELVRLSTLPAGE
jgi:helix-turn-helix protein